VIGDSVSHPIATVFDFPGVVLLFADFVVRL